MKAAIVGREGIREGLPIALNDEEQGKLTASWRPARPRCGLISCRRSAFGRTSSREGRTHDDGPEEDTVVRLAQGERRQKTFLGSDVLDQAATAP
jgi:hypothetical protein